MPRTTEQTYQISERLCSREWQTGLQNHGFFFWPYGQAFSGAVLLPSGKVFCVPLTYQALHSYIGDKTIYNPATNAWETGPIGPTSVDGSKAFSGGVLLPSGKVFCIPHSYTGNQTIYNPTTNAWETGVGLIGQPDPPSSQQYAGGVLLPNGKVFAVPHNYSLSLFHTIYNPATNAWQAGPSGEGNGAYWGAVNLPNGKVFVVPYNHTGTDTLFDPASQGQWQTGPIGHGNEAFRGGVLLPNGKVFCVPFGYMGNQSIYNPTTNAWETGPDMGGYEWGSLSGGVLLPNGKVFCFPYYYTGSYTIYNPITNAWEKGPSATLYNGAPCFNGGVLLPSGKVFCSFMEIFGNNHAVYDPSRSISRVLVALNSTADGSVYGATLTNLLSGATGNASELAALQIANTDLSGKKRFLDGISFGTSNLLQYNEGTWTPVGVCADVVLITVLYARWTLIGSLCFICCGIEWPSMDLANRSASAKIRGLPFDPSSIRQKFLLSTDRTRNLETKNTIAHIRRKNEVWEIAFKMDGETGGFEGHQLEGKQTRISGVYAL